MVWEPEVEEIKKRINLAAQMGGEKNVERHHSRGRLTVRERIDLLVDTDTFHEIGALAGNGKYNKDGKLIDFTPTNLIIGTGKIDGNKVVIAANDFTIDGGALEGPAEEAILKKIEYAEKFAHDFQLPLVRLVDSAGGSIRSMEEDSGGTYIPVIPGWDYVVKNMETVPVITACLGSVAGHPSAQMVASHFSVMVQGTSQLMIAGPAIVKQGMGEDLGVEELGGADVQKKGGNIDNVVNSEHEAFEHIRRFLSYLPRNVWELPPVKCADDSPDRREEGLLSAIPKNRRKVYKVREILPMIFDKNSLFEMTPYFGSEILTFLARLNGHSVSVIASNPYARGGGLTVQGAEKMMRFIDFCQTFHLPIVNLVDQPGLVIGLDSEKSGLLRKAVRAISAVYQSDVPMVEVIMRKVFGVGGGGMINAHGSKGLNIRYAWPSADWGSLPPEGGIQVAYRRELEESENPQDLLQELLEGLETARNPLRTAEKFGIEEIIDPRDTRRLLCDWVLDAYRLLPQQLGPSKHGMRP